MTAPKFILSKSKLLEQYNKLKELGLKVSYSYKTNHEVGKVLQELEGAEDCEFSIHAFEEIEDIKDKSKISFFTQAENKEELKLLLEKGIRNFVVDNVIDLRRLLKVVESFGEKINLSLRMKFQEHRIGTGKYFVYGMSAGKVNELLNKIKEVVDWSNKKNIQTIIEPGRFLAAPAIQLETEIIQIQEKNLIINTTIYNCAVDNVLTGTKMLVEGELDEVEEGNYYLIKGNSPTRDDIFRYRVKLKNPKVGDKIIFLNAGAYNYTTDFFGYKKLKTEIKE